MPLAFNEWFGPDFLNPSRLISHYTNLLIAADGYENILSSRNDPPDRYVKKFVSSMGFALDRYVGVPLWLSGLNADLLKSPITFIVTIPICGLLIYAVVKCFIKKRDKYSQSISETHKSENNREKLGENNTESAGTDQLRDLTEAIKALVNKTSQQFKWNLWLFFVLQFVQILILFKAAPFKYNVWFGPDYLNPSDVVSKYINQLIPAQSSGLDVFFLPFSVFLIVVAIAICIIINKSGRKTSINQLGNSSQINSEFAVKTPINDIDNNSETNSEDQENGDTETLVANIMEKAVANQPGELTEEIQSVVDKESQKEDELDILRELLKDLNSKVSKLEKEFENLHAKEKIDSPRPVTGKKLTYNPTRSSRLNLNQKKNN